MAEQSARTNWPDRIHAVFKRHGIRQVGYVPDHGLTRLIELCCQDNEITDVVLTTEAEGPALALGATLGGERAALMMQSSGVGNCLNAFSLLRNCAVPCVILVTMRGEFNDFNPWQVPMGQITEPALKLAGFQTYRVEQEADRPCSRTCRALLRTCTHDREMRVYLPGVTPTGRKVVLPPASSPTTTSYSTQHCFPTQSANEMIARPHVSPR